VLHRRVEQACLDADPRVVHKYVETAEVLDGDAG
jgi:hypothetical protein